LQQPPKHRWLFVFNEIDLKKQTVKYFLQYQIITPDEEKRALTVAMLASFGFEGFEETETGLIANAERGLYVEEEVEEWLNEQGLVYDKIILEDQNWNALWESNFDPVLVDDFVHIRAHFHPPVAGVLNEILITPKMSFGTGHHATTRQMIQMMRDLPFSGKTVFDFGTGTGVLAILAEKLGASRVEAIDIDEWSITNAKENFDANHMEKILLRQSDNLEGVVPADIILANINKHIIISFLPELVRLLKPGGSLVLSGLLKEDEKDILVHMETLNLLKHKGSVMGEWIALEGRRKPPIVKLL
jgi:ribosomal protein L11 methyltransferase